MEVNVVMRKVGVTIEMTETEIKNNVSIQLNLSVYLQ